ncbi:MAG: hypothetical protein R3E79_26920 [Caldilineaceae bacterium]
MLKPVQASTYTFRKIIDGGFLYVDKTEYLYKLVRPASGVYFLAQTAALWQEPHDLYFGGNLFGQSGTLPGSVDRP